MRRKIFASAYVCPLGFEGCGKQTTMMDNYLTFATISCDFLDECYLTVLICHNFIFGNLLIASTLFHRGNWLTMLWYALVIKTVDWILHAETINHCDWLIESPLLDYSFQRRSCTCCDTMILTAQSIVLELIQIYGTSCLEFSGNK